MNKFLKPWTLLLSVSLPYTAMFIIFGRLYSFLHTDMEISIRERWTIAFVLLLMNFLIATIYGAYKTWKKEEIEVIPPILILGVSIISLVYISMENLGLSSRTVELFMDMSPTYLLFSIICIGILHSMFSIVAMNKLEFKKNKEFKNLMMIILPPVGMYLIFNLSVYGRYDITPFIFVILILVFGFGILNVLRHKGFKLLKKYSELVGVVLLITSIAGLMLNQGIGSPFGCFNNWRFYVLDIMACLCLIIKAKSDKTRLLVYGLKCMTFAFSLYFFVVFIPYMPLSLIGILVLGLGLLILVPAALFVVHSMSIYRDFNNLKSKYSVSHLICIGLVAFLILPTSMGVVAYRDKGALDTALKFVYESEVNNDKEINIRGVKRSLANVRTLTVVNRGEEFFSTGSTKVPFITKAYNEIVLNGLTISESKIETLENIFLGKEYYKEPETEGPRSVNSKVYIKDMKTETEYIADGDYYESWVDLDIYNSGGANNEFITKFELNNTTYISDYYLNVFGKKKYGMIADKRAANWIYNRIRRVNRDPGLLTYEDDNKVTFKVFPFGIIETRKTGIKLIHKYPFELKLENKTAQLTTDKGSNSELVEDAIKLNSGGLVVSPNLKETLALVDRQKEYYFIIDGSKHTDIDKGEYKKIVDEYISKNGIEKGDVAEISIQNYRNYSVDDIDFKNQGGLLLDQKIKDILKNNYMSSSDKAPIIIVASDDMSRGIINDDIEKYSIAMPEGLRIYNLDKDGKLRAYDLSKLYTSIRGISSPVTKSVYKYADDKGLITYLEDNGDASIIIKGFSSLKKEDNLYNTALALRVAAVQSRFYPDDIKEANLNLVKYSIENNIMNDLTSFIVLETETQEKALLLKQKQILESHSALDIDDMVVMDEPDLIWVILIGVLVLIWFRRKKYSTT